MKPSLTLGIFNGILAVIDDLVVDFKVLHFLNIDF